MLVSEMWNYMGSFGKWGPVLVPLDIIHNQHGGTFFWGIAHRWILKCFVFQALFLFFGGWCSSGLVASEGLWLVKPEY